MRIKKYFLHLSLMFMIGLSFYLTYLIWASPATKEGVTTQDTESTKVTSDSNYPTAAEIFLPLKAVAVKDQAAQATNNETLLQNLQSAFAKAKMSDFKIKKYDLDTDLAKKMELANGIEMDYAVSFPLKQYAKFFDIDIPLADSFSFSALQLDYDHNKVRFINQEKKEIAEGTITSSLAAFQKATAKKAIEWFKVVKDPTLDRFEYYNDEKIQLKKYSYIATTRPYTMFRDAFFSSRQNLRTNENTEELNIYDGGESMVIAPDTQKVDFQGVVKDNKNFDKYSNSYHYVRQLGTNYGSVRFLDSDEQAVNYRIFVEGFPVFSDVDEGKFLVKYSDLNQDKQRSIEVQANLNIIQVPIPSDSVVELAPAKDILSDLYYAGAKSNLLQQLLVGYSWKNIKDTGVVDLEPAWYVRYNNQWYEWQDLVRQLQKEVG